MLGQIKEEEENDNRGEIKGGQCGLHKIQTEFICVNQACKGYLSLFCSKCAMKQHRNCEFDSWTKDATIIRQEQESVKILQQTFVEEAQQLKMKLIAMFDRECDGISKSILKGNQITSEIAKEFIDMCKKPNCVNNQFSIFPKNKELGKAVSVFEDMIEESHEPINYIKETTTYAYSVTNETTNSQLNESSLSTISFNSHRQYSHPDQQLNRLENISFSSQNNPIIKEDLSFSSYRSQISSISPSCKSSSSLNSSRQILSIRSAQKQDSPSRAVSIANIKGMKEKGTLKLDSKKKYVKNFCLFVTKANNQYDSHELSATNPSQLQLNFSQNQPSTSSNLTKYYLITQCKKKAMSVFDLDQQKEISRISFTHNSKLIYFKQFSETQVVIYSPKTTYIWIQNIFDETNFIQVDVKFSIDSLEIDVSLGLIFFAHPIGKISVWNVVQNTYIVEDFDAHKSAITMMDYGNGQLFTCCEDGSVKQHNFSNQNQKFTFVRTLIIEGKYQSSVEKPTYVKIIDNSTVVIENQNEFLEVDKNGVRIKEDSNNILEYFTTLKDMKIYESRYGILKSFHEENIACVYDFQKLKMVKILKVNEEKGIYGAYFLQGHIVLLLDDSTVQFFV